MAPIDWSQLITAEDKAKQEQQRIRDSIAARRWSAETGGILWGDKRIATDRESRSVIDQELAAVDRGVRKDGEFWKCFDADGNVVFWSASNQEFTEMTLAVRQYVIACFAREAEILYALDNGTYKAEMLEQGWPSDQLKE